MAQQQLSPRKYIQSRARTLPVYKCLVNADWQNTSLASVMVLRRHVNGNITGANYLVDLLALGVKDTFFWFNEDESEIVDRFPPGMMTEIDYNLAHNIVWAGHDFAADLGLDPHKDFELTKMVLEEDDDRIPLIEIPTGNEEGKPVLVAQFPGQYAAQLAILKKNLGDDFTYVIGEPDEEDEFSEPTSDLKLGDIPSNQLSLGNVLDVSLEDLLNQKLLDSRPAHERPLLIVERYLRLLPTFRPEYFEDIEDFGMQDEDWDRESTALTMMPGSSAAIIDMDDASSANPAWIEMLSPGDERLKVENVRRVIEAYADNAWVLSQLTDFILLTETLNEVPELIFRLEALSQDYLLPKIMLARVAAEYPSEWPQHQLPMDPLQNSIREAYPEFGDFDIQEHYNYFLLQLQHAIGVQDLRGAVRAYSGLIDIDQIGSSLILLQIRFAEMLQGEFEAIEENEDFDGSFADDPE